MVTAIILLAVFSVASLGVSIRAWSCSQELRKAAEKESEFNRKLVKAFRRLMGHLRRQDSLVQKRIAGQFEEMIKAAAEARMPGILTQLQTEQKAVNVSLAKWIRREEKRFRILLNTRVKPIEVSVEHAATLSAKVAGWLRKIKPWGDKPVPDSGSASI